MDSKQKNPHMRVSTNMQSVHIVLKLEDVRVILRSRELASNFFTGEAHEPMLLAVTILGIVVQLIAIAIELYKIFK